MANIIGGFETGLLDSSLYLLNRNDRTREGVAGHEEELYVNVSNGNLMIRHLDAFLPSQGEDFSLVRTYNGRGRFWTVSSSVQLDVSQITKNKLTLFNADASQYLFNFDSASGKYLSVDGSGAFEEITFSSATKLYTLVRSNQSRLTFDNNGTLLSSQDTNGVSTDFIYKAGKLVEVRDDQGHVLTYVYSGGNLSQIKDETGAVLVTYLFQGGLLERVTDRAGHVTNYVYFVDGSISRIILSDNNLNDTREIKFHYALDSTDATGKTLLLRSIDDAMGNTTVFEYAFVLNARTNQYDGGATVMLNALGNARRTSNLQEYIDWRNTNGYYQISNGLWDPNLYSTNAAYRAQADEIKANYSTRYTYDANGALLTVTEPRGFTARYQYDLLENLITVIDANAEAITKSDDPYFRDLRRDFGYVNTLTGQGKIVSELTATEVAELVERYTTHLEYDPNGNLITRIDNEDNVTRYTYTPFNKLASETSAVGNALITSDDAFYQDKRKELGYINTTTGAGKLVSELTAAEKQAILALFTTNYTYDAKQNLIEIKTPGGDLTRFQYDLFGNLKVKTVYLDQTDLVTPAKQQITEFFYDAFGNNIKTLDAQGNTMFASFDHFGNRTSFIDGRGNVTTYTYDNDNRLLTVTDPEGHVTVNSYDSVGNRVSVKDANGHSVIYVYDRNNMLITVTDPALSGAAADRITRFQYDVIGNQTALTDAEGRTTTYVYREDNRLLDVLSAQVADAQGVLTQFKTTYDYDGVGNRITVKDHNNNLTHYVYNQDNLLKQTTDAVGQVTQYRYDANLNRVSVLMGAQLAPAKRQLLRFGYDEEDQLIAQTDALGNTTRYDYDAPGNRIRVTDSLGHPIDFDYDKNNRLLKETRPAVIDPNTGLSVRYTVTHQYDANGNEIATTDENGHVTKFTFDKDNRLVLVEDGNGIKTVFTYDSRHNRTSIQIGVSAHVDLTGKVVIDSPENAQVTTHTYDEFNQLVAKTDGVGNALTTADSPLYRNMRKGLGFIDAATGEGKLVAQLTLADKQALKDLFTERYTYDKVGNTTRTSDHLGRSLSLTYDALNRQVTRTDALGNVTRFAFDGNGNRVKTTDAEGRLTTHAYDAVNRLTDTTDALGVIRHRDYDSFGNLIAQTRAAGTLEARTTQYIYDLDNRLTRQTDSEGHSQNYVYDAVGNRLQVTDARGAITRYVYDALNRNIKIIDPLNFQTKFEYDGVGNRITIIDAKGGIQRLTYDGANRYIKTTDAEGRSTSFTYDVRGNRITMTTAFGAPEAETTTFDYDAENNLRSVTDAEGNSTTHDYDRVYNRTEMTDGNGNKTSYAFDALNRQIQVTDAEGGISRFSYDAVSNRLSQTDALGRLTTYVYDARNQLITQTAADGVQTRFAYDKVGNRVDITRAAGAVQGSTSAAGGGTPGVATAEAQHTRFVYDRDDRLIATIDAIGNGLAESNSTEYQALRVALGYPVDIALLTDAQKAALRALHATRTEYDPNHNVTRTIDALNRVTVYEYDANNRVTRIIDPLGQVTTYAYDGNGNRVQVIDALGNRTTTYYNAVNEAVLAVDAEGALTSFAYDGNGNRIAMTRFATALATPADPSSRPIPVADALRDQTTHYLYDRNNRLIRGIDGEGYTVDTQYDAVGNVVATKGYANKLAINPSLPLAGQVPAPHADDRLTQFLYDKVDRLIRRIDAEGFHTAYAYDAVDNRIQETRFLDQADFVDPLKQQVTRLAYDAMNRVIRETSALGIETRHTYDLVGNRIAAVEAFGLPETRTWQYAYDDVNRLVTQTNPEGTVTRHVYDAAGQMLQKIEADGLNAQRLTQNRYDANGRLMERTHPDGSLTRYAYDALGNLLRQTDAAGSLDSRDRAYAYDRDNRLVSETVAAGTAAAITRRYEYDAFGNRTREVIAPNTPDARITQYQYDRVNHLVTQIDGNGILTRFTYDTFGNVIRREITGQTLALGGAVITRMDAASFAYDGRDLLTSETNAAGDVRTRAYDALGNLRFETRGAGTLAASVTEYRYDAGNRLVEKLVNPQGLALRTQYQYDARNNLAAETNANGHRLTSRYDIMNRAVEVADALGFSTTFTYDVFGNQTSITTGQYLVSATAPTYDPQKAAVALPATARFAYDAMHRMTSQTDALGVVTKFAYDVRGNRTQKIEVFGTGAQRTSSYRYDLADRLVDEIQPLGTVLRHDYNAAGELAAKTVDFGVGAQFKNAATRYSYDAGGRLASETDPVGAVTRYDYDSFGNRIRVTRGFGTPAQRATELVYDGAQRLVQEIVDLLGLRLSTRYEYDARGNQIAITNANGQRGESVYDAADRVVWQRDAEGNIARFVHDGRGNKIQEIRYATRGATLAKGATPAVSAQDRNVQFRYDANDRLVERVDARGGVNRLRYDAVGNVLENTENATGLFGAGPRSKTYRYNLANLVVVQTEANGLKTLFEYDAVYNVTRKTAENRWLNNLELQVCDYRYDLNNRMIEEITDLAGLALHKTYRYDALGNRVAEVSPNGPAALRDDSAWAQGIRRGLGLVDAFGNVIPAAQLTAAQRQQVLDAFTTRTYFDAAGRPTFTVDPRGQVKEARHDAVGNLIRAIQYANTVPIAGLTDHTPPAVVADPNNDRNVEYVYDKADRRLETRLDPVRVFVGGQWVDGHRPTTLEAYDGVGNVVRQTDANGNTTHRYFDGNGLEIGSIDAEGFLTVNDYDPFGNKLAETLYLERQPLTAAQKEGLDLRAYAPAGPSRVIQHVYDLGNHEIETRYPSADLFIGGQPSTQTVRVQRSVDAFGQVLTETVMHAAADAAPAYKAFTYDAAGRIAAEIDARAQELIQSDAAYFVALRKDLGFVNAAGQGKLAAELTAVDKQALRQRYTTTYAYDAANNLREKVEDSRVTTFEYDRANRNTRVHLPALNTVAVDANGNVTTAAGVRFAAEIGYDAAGNRLRELRSDGAEILYRYDRANRQIAAVDQSNVYTEYGYDFSGNRTLTRRYFNPVANRAAPERPATHAADQLIEFDYDRGGRLVRERQEGDFSMAADNRVTQFGYDANGNQVEIIDPRDFASRMTYDALNRMVELQNPNGGVTVTQYDALGKVAARQVGGWSAPAIVGDGVTQTLVSNRGAVLTFATDHATSAVVHVRRAGTLDPFLTFGNANVQSVVHAIKLDGLAADTLYEYHIVVKDAFGFTLTTATRTFRTGHGVESAVLTNLRPVAGSTTQFDADVHFALTTSVQNLAVAVGRAGDDPLSLASETLFTPVQQADGSYSVTLRFTDPATAFFQIRWSDGVSNYSTETSPVQQRQALRVFDGRLSAVSVGNNAFNLSATWDLSAAFAANEISSYIDSVTGQKRYNVFVGVTLNDAQTPAYIEAVMPGNDGVFRADFNNVVDTPRKLHFYYVMTDGSLVTAGPLSVPTLNGLDVRHQRIELSFPDLDTAGATLVFRHRLQGTTTWNTLPASAVDGLSVNVLGLAEGNYEYQADLMHGASVLRTSEGSFKLREPGSVNQVLDLSQLSNLVDSAAAGTVSFTVTRSVIAFPGLLPLGPGEALKLEIADSAGVTTQYPFADAQFDTAVLAPGTYALHIVKTRTTTTTDPATGLPTTTTVVVNDITGSLKVQPPVSFTVNDNLFSVAGLTPLAAGEALTIDVTDALGVTTRHLFGTAAFDLTVLAPGDYSFKILKTRTTTTGTPPTTTTTTVVQNDIRGNIHIAPLVLTAAAANALSGVRALESFNRTQSLAQMPAVTVTGTNTSADHVFSFYDGLGWRTFSNENGGVWTRTFFDGAGNVTKEVRFRIRDYADPLNPRFVDTIVDPKTRPSLVRLLQDYDAAVAAHNPAAGVDTIRITEYSFDAAGNKLSETGVSQAYGRVTDEYRYDRFNNKIREVTAKGRIDALGNSLEQTTEYAYDAANRLTRTTVGPFQFFDSNGNGFFTTASVAMTYDGRGFKSTEESERGHVRRFHHDAQGRLAREWDAAKQDPVTGSWPSTLRTDHVYDAFGRAVRKTETDLSGRASVPTRSVAPQYDNFDQVTVYDLAGRTTRMQYDQAGNKIADTNALGHTERYDYDGENRLVARTDRLGNASFKSYDAYGQVISETDANGRVTTYTIGAFGQVLAKHTTLTRGIPANSLTPVINISGSGWIADLLKKVIAELIARIGTPGRNLQEGRASYTETTTNDWAGRTIRVTDTYGRNIQSAYDDADRLTGVTDFAQNQTASYSYDVRGLKTGERLSQGGAVLRDQTNSYNARGWLTGVDTEATLAFGGSSLSQPIHVFFRYDQAGNRVWVGDNKYVYDFDHRMLMGYDGKNRQTVEALEYDGFGNRVSITQAGATTAYRYSAQGEVLTAKNAAGTVLEEWQYDALGNATFHRGTNGDTQTTTYDAENRAVSLVATSGGQTTRMSNVYDAAGNLGIVRTSSSDYGFDEVTFRDVKYDEQRKGVENSWVNGAQGLRGQTVFSRNANGELIFLDRGRKQDARENTVAGFTYDNEGHITARSDRALAGTDAAFFQGYVQDPDVAEETDDFGFRRITAEIRRRQLLNGLPTGTTHLQSFVYADGKPVAEASADHNLSLKKLTLQGGEAVTDATGQVTGWIVAIAAADIVRNADGSVNRAMTARNLAARVYSGFNALAEESKARVSSYLQGRLPGTDAGIQAGAKISVHGFIQLLDGAYQNIQVRTDYYVKQIGQDGLPSGQIVSYTVRSGDTLQGIASQYYGSPDYWYLIAGANGLSGSQELQEGTSLTIPNVIANNINNKDTYKLYNENDIIGSTSPELITIPKPKKKKKWYQKLVQVLIIVIVVAVAIWSAGVLGPLLGAALAGIGTAVGIGVGATLLAIGVAVATAVAVAAAGYAIGYATGYVTQGLAILVGLQEKFDWKGMQNMGKSFAVSALAAGVTSWATTAAQASQGSYFTQTAYRLAGEVGSQLITNGKVENRTGLLMALVPGGTAANSGWKSTVDFLNKYKTGITAGLTLIETAHERDAGLNTLDWANAAVAALGSARMTHKDGSMNWAAVAQNALITGLGSAAVSHRLGEEASLNFLGQSLGRGIAQLPVFTRAMNAAFSPLVNLADSATQYLERQDYLTQAPLMLVGADGTIMNEPGIPEMDSNEALQRALNDPNARRISDSDNRSYGERLAGQLGVPAEEIRDVGYEGPRGDDDMSQLRDPMQPPGFGEGSSAGQGGAGINAEGQRSLPEGALQTDLSFGDKGDDVKALQKRLQSLGYEVGKADGDWGPKTEAAYQDYQREVEKGVWNISENGKHTPNLGDIPPSVVRVVYGEAASQSYASKVAVASVIQNRLEDTTHEFRKLTTYEDVIFQKNAFEAVGGDLFNKAANPEMLTGPSLANYNQAARAVINVTQDFVNDNTGGALYYYSPYIPQPSYITTGLKAGTLEQVFPLSVKTTDFRFFRYAQ